MGNALDMPPLFDPVAPSGGDDPDAGITDEALTAEALAADPDGALSDDAVPFWQLTGGPLELLPSWYMPAMGGRMSRLKRWQRWTLAALVVAFVGINAYGLCSTYGFVVPA
jgi:hypothetical protein